MTLFAAIAAGGLSLLLLLIAYACCYVASEADERAKKERKQ